MKSIRRGLWDGEVRKDTRGRFACGICRQSLTTDAETDETSPVRTCPDCGRAWKSRETPPWRTAGR
ncbi:HVO_0758 family zinc finger protein [Halorussus lipolyticus]|uniref:HVO_0758 family zinc finger protein n=1 Tax=Halorussus lipolyticus TaxID=3034024 RepID=UPI0023E864EF|nr:HVO_0758 family zinc finger protein [Halorussus sp. DT80]